MDLLPQSLHSSWRAHKGAVLACSFNSDGCYVVTGGSDKKIRLWNPYKQHVDSRLVKEYVGSHGYEVRDIAVSPDNSRLASCGGDRQAFVWSVEDGRVLRRLGPHTQRVTAVSFNENASVVCSGSYDSFLRAWDLRASSRDPICVMKNFKDSISRIEIRQTEIIASCIDGCVRTFDLRAGRLVTDHIAQAITSMCLSNDNNCLLLGCLDNTMRLIDRTSGELLSEYRGHVNTQYAVGCCFTNDDAHVLSGSEDGVIRFFDLVEGRVVHSLKTDQKIVLHVLYHPKETCMISAGNDGSLSVWR